MSKRIDNSYVGLEAVFHQKKDWNNQAYPTLVLPTILRSRFPSKEGLKQESFKRGVAMPDLLRSRFPSKEGLKPPLPSVCRSEGASLEAVFHQKKDWNDGLEQHGPDAIEGLEAVFHQKKDWNVTPMPHRSPHIPLRSRFPSKEGLKHYQPAIRWPGYIS